ncbi:hypothetical protein L5515_015512 [Caenorhabditis briggsae]|uniref:Uncharacterized protein n=1 Tax=Caenorhabditis briggsae TaxID=6238 RepID=A0AAE9JA84_CAEBR|nr:hypothetical protein L5515_015512 [Caenorhabditis briggsae]
MDSENDHFGHQGPGPIDHLEAMNNQIGQNHPWNLEQEEEPYNQFYRPQRPRQQQHQAQQQHQQQVQQNPQNVRNHHNQFYPEGQEQNRMNDNGRLDLQHQRDRRLKLHPHYRPYVQIQENGQQQHLNQQCQQRIHEHGQRNQVHQRDHQPQLHPHHQIQENGQHHGQNLQNQQHVNQHGQMNQVLHHQQQQNQFHQERQRFQEVQHHQLILHRNQQQHHQVHDRIQRHHTNQQWHHHQQNEQPQQPINWRDMHQSEQLVQNQNHDLRQNPNHDLRQNQNSDLLQNQNQQLLQNQNQDLRQNQNHEFRENQQPDRQAQGQHHRMHMPHNNQVHLQRRHGPIPTHHHHLNANRYNPIVNDQNRRGRPTAVEQNRREQELGAMNEIPHLQNGDPFDNGGIHFQGNQWGDPMLGQFNQELPEASRQVGNPPIHLNGPAVAQMQQSLIPVPQDPMVNPQPLNPEIKRLREENRQLTDRIVALHDLHPISQEDLALLQKELGELKGAKTRLETENLAQKQDLERVTNLSCKTGQENTALKSRNVYLEMRVKVLEGELAKSHGRQSSAAPIPAVDLSDGTTSIKKEIVEDHDDIRPDHEVRVVAMVKSKKKAIKREVIEMPKTAKEAVERYEEMFEGKIIISERFDIRCFLFDKTEPGEEKNGKWVPRKVLKACQLRNFYQHFRPKRENPEWKEVKNDAKVEERWRKRWMAVREEQIAQYHAGLIFFNDDYKNLNL